MRVVWSARAIADLACLRAHIAHANPKAATDVARRISECVDHIARFPAMGRAGRVPDTRELIIPGTPFIATYAVREDTVEIVAVVHAAREWPRK